MPPPMVSSCMPWCSHATLWRLHIQIYLKDSKYLPKAVLTVECGDKDLLSQHLRSRSPKISLVYIANPRPVRAASTLSQNKQVKTTRRQHVLPLVVESKSFWFYRIFFLPLPVCFLQTVSQITEGGQFSCLWPPRAEVTKCAPLLPAPFSLSHIIG